jgi:outer membrane protein assembly factor BamE (lipoprotein component of BamABCDE complex)
MHASQRIQRAILGAALCGLLLGGCAATYRNHGYVPNEEDLQMIVPGVDTRATVEDVIGIPTTGGVVNEQGYYYIRTRMRTFGAKAPEITDRTILAISFDKNGVVENITEYGLQDGQVVPLARRVTRSGDGEISFIRKLFGNIGGLSAEQLLGS